jgi:hypothetical protein
MDEIAVSPLEGTPLPRPDGDLVGVTDGEVGLGLTRAFGKVS